MKKLILILAFCVVHSLAFGTTYYMRSDGTAANKGSATSCSAASTSMDEALHNSETFAAGDTITLCDDGGAFETGINTPSAGTTGNPITYTVASGDSILFEGTSGHPITIDEDYITVELGSGTKFEVKNCGGSDNMILIQASSGTVDHVVLDGLTIGPDNTEGGIKIDDATYVTVKNCYVWNTGNNASSEDEHIAILEDASFIYIEYCDFKADTLGGDAFVLSGPDNVHIRYNNFHDFTWNDCAGECAEQFIDIKDNNTPGTFNIFIYGNLFDGVIDYSAIIVHNANYGDSLGDTTIKDIYIYGNFFTKIGNPTLEIWARNNRDIEGVYIFSNIFFLSGVDEEVIAITGGGSGQVSKAHAFNNTFLDNYTYVFDISELDEKGGSNSAKNNIAENSTAGTLLFSNPNAKPITTTYGRWYDSSGTARCDDSGGTERDCNDEANFGADNEIAQTTFINRTNGANLSTDSNITPAEDLGHLCAVCDYGIKEGYDFTALGPNSGVVVEMVSRDLKNSGVWGKGAVVFESESTQRGVWIQ